MTSRLMIVSNRLPVTLRRSGGGWRTEHSAGGLATAMNPILNRTGGLWIGWPGDSPASRTRTGNRSSTRWATEHRLSRRRSSVRQSPSASTRALPTRPFGLSSTSSLRASPSTPRVGKPTWRPTSASETWCSRITSPGDPIWVHDYHLMLLPQHASGGAAGGARSASSCTSRSRPRTSSGSSRGERSCSEASSAPTARIPDPLPPAAFPRLGPAHPGDEQPDGPDGG